MIQHNLKLYIWNEIVYLEQEYLDERDELYQDVKLLGEVLYKTPAFKSWAKQCALSILIQRGTFEPGSGREPPLGHFLKIPMRSYGKLAPKIGLRLHTQIHIIALYTLQAPSGFPRFFLGIYSGVKMAQNSQRPESAMYMGQCIWVLSIWCYS